MLLTTPKADPTSLLQAVGRQMGEAIQLREDAGFVLLFNGDCWQCGKKYKRAVWLVKHLRAKHG